MELPDWVPATMDVSKPSPARMYDYYLGGTHNFEVDRDAAERAIAAMPYTIQGARGNRDFLRRAVRLLGRDREFCRPGRCRRAGHNRHQQQRDQARATHTDTSDNDPA